MRHLAMNKSNGLNWRMSNSQPMYFDAQSRFWRIKVELLFRIMAYAVIIAGSLFPTARAQDVAVLDPSGVRLSEAFREQITEEIRTQANMIQTAQISFLYYLSGKKDVEREQMELFLSDFIGAAADAPVSQNVKQIVDTAFPGRGGPKWQRGSLTIEGDKKRERLQVLSPESDEVIYVRESVFDGKNASMLLTDSGQATLFGPVARFSTLGIDDMRCSAASEVLNWPLTQEPHGRLRFTSSQNADASYVLDTKLRVFEYLSSGDSKRYALDWQKFDAVLLPRLSIQVHYRKGLLYRFSVLVLEEAMINQQVNDSFTLAVSKGTVISDQRPHRGDRPMAWTAQNDIPSIVDFVTARDEALAVVAPGLSTTIEHQQTRLRVIVWIGIMIAMAALAYLANRTLRRST